MTKLFPRPELLVLMLGIAANANCLGAGPELLFTNALAPGALQGAGGDSVHPIATPDGRYVVFSSTAPNLISTTNGLPLPVYSVAKLNVYRYDRTTKQAVLVSAARSGDLGANADAHVRGVSDDGQLVLFETAADNILASDTNVAMDVFLRDVEQGTTLLVTANSNGLPAAGWHSVMSRDGANVAFVGASRYHFPTNNGNIPDVLLRNLQKGSTALVTPFSRGVLQGSDAPLITPDGRYVAFLSVATNLVAGVTNQGEIYVRDTELEVTKCASFRAHELLPGAIASYSHTISDDGQFVCFIASTYRSPMAGFVLQQNVFTGEFYCLSSNAVGARSIVSGFRSFRGLEMSRDGRFVAFLERSADGGSRVCLWDGQTRVTTIVSVDTNELEITNTICEWPGVSADGRYVSFISDATNVVNTSLGSGYHLYVRDMVASNTWCADPWPDIQASMQFVSPPSWPAEGNFLVLDAVTGRNGFNSDVFLVDANAKLTELISPCASDLISATQSAIRPQSQFFLSSDARFVTFLAPQLEASLSAPARPFQIYAHDRKLQTNRLVLFATNHVDPANGSASDLKVSADGRTAVFTSYATNLAPGDTNQVQDVFAVNIDTGSLELVSVNRIGRTGNGPSFAHDISADGRRVLFRSKASDLTSGSGSYSTAMLLWRDIPSAQTRMITNSFACAALSSNGQFIAYGGKGGAMFIYDAVNRKVAQAFATAVLAQISISPDGLRAAGTGPGAVYAMDRLAQTQRSIASCSLSVRPESGSLAFSSDGRYLVFTTTLPQVPSDTNGLSDVYVYDFQSGTNQLLSRQQASELAGNGASDLPAISPDGRYVAFRSLATNLVSGATGPAPNLYLHDRESGTTLLLTPRTGRVLNPLERPSMPVFSLDGTTLAFDTWATDLVPNDYNQAPDIFLLRLGGSGTVFLLKGEILLLPGGSLTPLLAWQTEPGKSYRLEFKNGLDEAVWQRLETTIEVQAVRASATDPFPAVAQRFYRVVAID